MGALKEIQKVTLDSDTNSVSLTGIDSTYNVYMVTITNLKTATDNKNCLFRVNKSGSADTNSEYDNTSKNPSSASTYGNNGGTNSTSATFAFSLGNGTGEAANAMLYLFNFPNSEYSFVTARSVFLDMTPNLIGFQGAIIHTAASASDGVTFLMESAADIKSGAKFALYGISK